MRHRGSVRTGAGAASIVPRRPSTRTVTPSTRRVVASGHRHDRRDAELAGDDRRVGEEAAGLGHHGAGHRERAGSTPARSSRTRARRPAPNPAWSAGSRTTRTVPVATPGLAGTPVPSSAPCPRVAGRRPGGCRRRHPGGAGRDRPRLEQPHPVVAPPPTRRPAGRRGARPPRRPARPARGPAAARQAGAAAVGCRHRAPHEAPVPHVEAGGLVAGDDLDVATAHGQRVDADAARRRPTSPSPRAAAMTRLVGPGDRVAGEQHPCAVGRDEGLHEHRAAAEAGPTEPAPGTPRARGPANDATQVRTASATASGPAAPRTVSSTPAHEACAPSSSGADERTATGPPPRRSRTSATTTARAAPSGGRRRCRVITTPSGTGIPWRSSRPSVAALPPHDASASTRGPCARRAQMSRKVSIVAPRALSRSARSS